MIVKNILDTLEQFAPLPLQEGYDNAGLQCGVTDAEVSGVLLCLDVTETIIEEAIQKGCNVVVSHHPLLFHGLKCISEADYISRVVMKAIKAGIAIIAMHTNLDAVKGGVNYKIADKIGLDDLEPLGDVKLSNGRVVGSEGLIGTLIEPLAADDWIKLIKETFHVECLECNELLRREIKKVAICGGAGSFLLDEAVEKKADAFLTGEMKYHEFFGLEQVIQITVIGHYQSEMYTPELLSDIIVKAWPDCKCFVSETNTNPILYF